MNNFESNRYHELKYFCYQYPIWVKARDAIGKNFLSNNNEKMYSNVEFMLKASKQYLYYNERIKMVEDCAKNAAPDFYKALILGITNKLGYSKLLKLYPNLTSKNKYYKAYKDFWFLLNKSHY